MLCYILCDYSSVVGCGSIIYTEALTVEAKHKETLAIIIDFTTIMV